MRKLIKYVADDGTEFDNEGDALRHEEERRNDEAAMVDKFLRTWSGKLLLEENSLTDDGVWEVRGEDPNCDLGGHHHNPFIGVVRGKLRDAIGWAVMQDRFWQWGAGGVITRRDILKV